MAWNHRVFLCKAEAGAGLGLNLGVEEWLEIRETHYDDSGRPNGWDGSATRMAGDDLNWLLSSAAGALSKPVLDGETGEVVGGYGEVVEAIKHRALRGVAAA